MILLVQVFGWKSSEETTASAQQIAASARELLSDNAQTLNHLVARFLLIT